MQIYTHLITIWMRGYCMALLLAALVLPSAQAAQPALAPADEKAVVAVVQAQLDAFAADDASKAFSFAAPTIQKMFGSAPRFLAMVREQYPVVYRPSSTAFFKPERQDDQVLLRVSMSDADGGQWLAVYSLQQQKDKRWRIAGCVVVPNNGRRT